MPRNRWITFTLAFIALAVVFCSGFKVGTHHGPAASGISVEACIATMDREQRNWIAAMDADQKSCVAHINQAYDRCAESQDRIAANCNDKMDKLEAQHKAAWASLDSRRRKP